MVDLPSALLDRLTPLAAAAGAPAVMYARISEDRVGSHLGVDRQLEDQCDLYVRHGLRLVGVYADNDLSAYSGKPRPDYIEMMGVVEAGLAGVITAWHTDRLHRYPTELEAYIGMCEPRSVATHTVKAGYIDLATPSGRMVARQLGAVARFESEHKAERIARARRQGALAGRYLGGRRPFGFEPGGMEVRAEEAVEIIAATEGLLSSAETLSSLVRSMNARGVLTAFGAQKWTTPALRDVLLRPRNAGLSVYRGEVVGKALWPALVPEDRWRMLVALLTDPGRRVTPGAKPRWLGSGLYVCGACGATEMRVQSGGWSNAKVHNRAPTYRCGNREAVVEGGHFARRAVNLDDFVERLLVARLARPDAVDLLRAPASAVDTVDLSARAVELRQRLQQLDDDLDEGRIGRDRWLRRNERMRGELDSLSAELTRASAADPLVGLAGLPDIAAVWFGLREDRGDGLSLTRRRAILARLATITVLRAGRGRRSDGSYFDPAAVGVEWLG
ncbi:recombinase family protein [Actinokineospora globicatena]|uniref:recombinase family protein n=1 Tax=Actinokineospora globicatena TaxID=103729 RepID=UPI002553FD53|nr:recombinase family protein [Actinokineospora globicatena]